MPLKFPNEWRINPPKSSYLNTDTITQSAIQDFMGLIRKTATQGDIQYFFEYFKKYFCLADGSPHFRSSSENWAETDLLQAMAEVSNYPPLFLEAFYNACESIKKRNKDLFVPDANLINQVCERNNIGYYIYTSELKFKAENIVKVNVEENSITFPQARLVQL